MSETFWNLQTILEAGSLSPRIHLSFFSVRSSSFEIQNALTMSQEFLHSILDGTLESDQETSHHHPGKEVSDHSRQKES